MRNIEIDGSRWAKIEDFHDAVLSALGAPDWHGRCLNALFDSILSGGINAVEPPYTIVIGGTASLDKVILDYIKTAKFYLAKARAETRRDLDRDVDATIEIRD